MQAQPSTQDIPPLTATRPASVGWVLPRCAGEGCLDAQARGAGAGS